MNDSLPPWKDSALILAGHGSTTNPDSSTPTSLHAATIRDQHLFREVLCCFWKESPSFCEVLALVQSSSVYIVPNFISEGYFTQTVIPREMGLSGKITRTPHQTIFYCDPVGSHPSMTEVLLHRASSTAPHLDPATTSLFIVGHGTSRNTQSSATAKRQADAIRQRNLYAQVEAVFMEEAPFVSDWASIASFPNALVIPFFISDGLHSYEDIPVLLGIEKETGKFASQQAIFRANPFFLRGKTLYYASSIGTEPLMSDLFLDQIRVFPSL